MEDTMCLGKFFTRAVTACGVTEQGPQWGHQGFQTTVQAQDLTGTQRLPLGLPS